MPSVCQGPSGLLDASRLASVRPASASSVAISATMPEGGIVVVPARFTLRLGLLAGLGALACALADREEATTDAGWKLATKIWPISTPISTPWNAGNQRRYFIISNTPPLSGAFRIRRRSYL
ncbi:MAG: hypothetical protein U0841_02655 [Chloroflexia bacterium]